MQHFLEHEALAIVAYALLDRLLQCAIHGSAFEDYPEDYN